MHLPVINLDVPKDVPGVDSKLLQPKNTWRDAAAYDARAQDLAKQFNDNWQAKYQDVSEDIHQAGPKAG